VAATFVVGHSAHLDALKQFHLVHEASQRESPAVTNSLEVLNLVFINLNGDKILVFILLSSGGSLDKVVNNAAVRALAEDLLGEHVVDNLHLGLVEGELTSVDVEVGVLGCFKGIRDTSELGDNTSASLNVKSLNVTGFANLKRGRDVSFAELEASILVELLGHIATFLVGGDESNKDDLSGHVEKLRDFRDAANVLSTVLSREAETLVEASADNVTIEDEDFLVIAHFFIESSLDGFGEGGLAST